MRKHRQKLVSLCSNCLESVASPALMSRELTINYKKQVSKNFRNFKRAFTPRNHVRSPRKLGKTRFRRFPTFHFSTPKKNFRRKFSIENFVFGRFCQVLGTLGPNGPQNHLRNQILLQILTISLLIGQFQN